MNRLRPLLCMLAGLLGCLQALAREPGEAYFQSVAGTDALANGVITALAQDARGLIWFGTTEGLFSYDGYRLRQYRHREDDPGSIGGDYVRALLARADGSLWVATQGAGLSIYEPARDGFHHLRHDEAVADSLGNDGPVTLADRDGAGDVWIGFGFGGFDRWDAASGRFRHFRPDPADPTALAHGAVRSLLVDRRGDLWIGTGNGLYRLRAGSAQPQRVVSDPAREPNLDGQYVYELYESGDGRIWIGTQTRGAGVLDPDSLRLRMLEVGPGGLGHAWIDGFVEPAPGILWIATFGAGIDVYDLARDAVVDHIRNDPALPGTLALDRVIPPLRDRSGIVWIGTWGEGLQWHNPVNRAAFTVIRHSPARDDGLSVASVLSLLELEDGRLWVGTDGNGIDVIDRHRGRVGGYRPGPEGLPDGTIRALARTRDGTRWIGTQQAGLLRYDASADRFLAVDLGSSDRRVPHLYASRDGQLWIGAQRGLARLDPADRSVHFLDRAGGGRFNDTVWAMAEDAAGNLWVSTPNALLLKPAGSDLLREPPPGLASPQAVMDLWIDDGGRLWTIGPAGIQRSRGERDGWPLFEPWGQGLQTLDPSFGRQWRPDRAGRLWTPQFLIDPDRGLAIPHGRAEGAYIGNVDIGARLSLADGGIAFGGTRGLLLIDPAQYRPWDYEPQLVATALEVDGSERPLADLLGGLRLGPDARRFSVEFAALDYAAPEQNRYAYRIEGVDRDWIETPAARRVAIYNNLWPGDYRLQVRGSGRQGRWSTHTLDIALTVLPAWWQTWWFALGCVLLAAALVTLAVRARTARMRRAADRLRQLVESRTAELSESKQRAEQALVDLRGAQSQLVAAEKLASLGQLVAGVAHEINTPIGIALTAASHLQESNRNAGAKLESAKLSRRDFDDWRGTVDEATRLILGSLERASTLITSFKQVSVDQSSEQRRRFLLNEFLGEVQVSLQPSFRRTPHRLQVDCPPGIDLDTYPGALFQIFTNFINNALLHAFAEGQHGLMRIRVEDLGSRVDLRFSDDGTGMPTEVAEHCFDPFFTTRRGSGGSGLGLHVVHNLVTQLLGGSLVLTTAPGAGTEFVIVIPKCAPAALPAAPG